MSEPIDFITPAVTPVLTERRANPRQRVLKGGTIRFNKGFGAAECTVRNVSEGGARLIFGDPLGVPPRFDIVISGDAARPADVRWRRGTSVGISFG